MDGKKGRNLGFWLLLDIVRCVLESQNHPIKTFYLKYLYDIKKIEVTYSKSYIIQKP